MDDREATRAAWIGNRLAVLPAVMVVVVLLPVGLAAVGVLARWRRWRGRDDGS